MELLDVGRGRRERRHAARRSRRRAAGRRTASRAARAPGGGRATPTRRGSCACCWISASVCSTESCTRAAMSERSSVRIRAVRSASRSSARRHTHGPPISSSAPATAPGASSAEEVPPPGEEHARRPRRARARRRRAAPRGGSCRPGATRARARPRRVRSRRPSGRRGRARRAARSPPRRRARPRPRRASPAVGPEGEVEEDPRPAGQRQQREDEPDERRRRPRGSARCLRRPPRSPSRHCSSRGSGAACGLIVRRARRGRSQLRRARRARARGLPCRPTSTSAFQPSSSAPSMSMCPAWASPWPRGRREAGGSPAGRRRRPSSRGASRPAGSWIRLRSSSSEPTPSR